MQVMNRDEYRQQVVAAAGNLAKLTPDTIKGYGAMGAAGTKAGHLDARTREPIAIAVAITLRCDGCIAVHADKARNLGITAEALGVAVSIIAGAAIVYSTRAIDSYQASADAAQRVFDDNATDVARLTIFNNL